MQAKESPEEGGEVLHESGVAADGAFCLNRMKLKSLLFEVASKSAPPLVWGTEPNEGGDPLQELV